MKIKRVLTLPVWKKTIELEQTFGFLRANSALKEFDLLLISSDAASSEVLDIVSKNIKTLPITTRIIHNASKLGVIKNTYEVHARAFFDYEADFILGLEDDIYLSPDALEFALWYSEWDQRQEFFALGLVNLQSRADAPLHIVKSDDSDCFDIKGICFTFENWITHMHRNNLHDERGYDWSMVKIVQERELKVLVPALARCKHNASHGVHVTSEYQRSYWEPLPVGIDTQIQRTEIQYDSNYK